MMMNGKLFAISPDYDNNVQISWYKKYNAYTNGYSCIIEIYDHSFTFTL